MERELVSRDRQCTCSGVALPFIFVQTHPHPTIEVEISEDMQLVHFYFNSTSFELHDDPYLLKVVRLHNTPSNGRKKGDSVLKLELTKDVTQKARIYYFR